MLKTSEAKKLISVLTISILMIGVKEEALVLECVPFIYCPVYFKKNINETQVQALIDSKSEINAIHLILIKELCLSMKRLDVGV